MYKNGYEPKVGDKVKRNWYDINMAEGEEGVVSWADERDRIRIAGKPEDAGFLASFFDLISRAVRYADGSDAAVGDLVECVKDARCDKFTGKVGARYEIAAVRGNLNDNEGGIDLKPQFDEANCGLRPIRFKLIARACPYKVGDWVHYTERPGPVEFQVKGTSYSDGFGWRIRDTEKPMQHNDMYAKDVKPGRLPCPYKVGDWVHSLERKVEFQVSNVRICHEFGWSLDGEKQGCFSWNVASLKPGRMPPQPAPQPLSVADEVRAIIDVPCHSFNRKAWDDAVVKKLADLINAKTERLEKLVLELNRKIVNQGSELGSLNDRYNNQSHELAAAKARVQSLNDIAANKEKALQVLFDQAHRRTAEIVDLKGTIADQSEILRKLRDEVASHRNFIHVNADYKALYENLRNKLREVAE